MGVQNLLPLVSPVAQKLPLTAFRGKRVAIDGFVWLHRGSFGCAREICKDPGSERILPYLAARMRRIRAAGIIPVVVFDGQSLPQKRNTNAKRHQERSENREKARLLEESGLFQEAIQYYQKGVEISFQTVYRWIKELKNEGIEYIVSPYEADAQLAYLARIGYVDCVLTEDSDLLVYQTPLTLFKWDDMNMVTCVKYDDVLRLLGLTSQQFTAVCCFSGCDYLDHINKIGIQTAIKMIKATGSGQAMIAALRANGKHEVPPDYEEQLERAMTTFEAQRVYDPYSKKLKTLVAIENPQDFLGPVLAPDLLADLVAGKIDTRTLQRVEPEPPIGKTSPYFDKKEEKTPDEKVKSKSPYFTKYKSGSAKKQSPKAPPSRTIASYFDLAPK